MTLPQWLTGSCLVLTVVLGTVSLADAQQQPAGQGVKWRYDYNAARREATERGRPLLIDIGTERCHWCQRLHTTTFRDPALTALLNERLVPLKLDGARESGLVEALRIQAYPTLVLAQPDGKIFETVEGYVEAARLTELVQRLLATGLEPITFSRDYQEAVTAIAARDYPRAIERLRRVAQGGQDRPLQLKARHLLLEIEQQAAAGLAPLKELAEQGQCLAALEALADFTPMFAHTAAAAEGTALAKQLAQRPEVKARQRERHARELVLLAREDFRAKRFLAALERCDAVTAQFADLPESTEAKELTSAIQDHPERLQQVCAVLSNRLGDMHLLLAESLLKQGRPAEAAAALEQVLQKVPGTRLAERAQARLLEVQGLFPREAVAAPMNEAAPRE